MNKENGERIKSNKLLKVAKTLSRVSMGFVFVSLAGQFGNVTGVLINSNNKNNFIDNISETTQYQQYYNDEKQEMEDAMFSKEITIDEYNKLRDELKENGVVKYIEEFGTEEEKEQLEEFMTHDKDLGISSRVFRDISFASVGVAVAGLGVVLAAERKQKKEFNEELEETRKAMGELLRSLDNDPFPDYTENDTTTDESEKE